MTGKLAGFDEAVEATQAEKARRSSTPCGVRTVLDELDDDDRATLNRVLGSRAWAAAVSDELAKRGITLTRHSIERHRRGIAGKPNGCACAS